MQNCTASGKTEKTEVEEVAVLLLIKKKKNRLRPTLKVISLPLRKMEKKIEGKNFLNHLRNYLTSLEWNCLF